jgi:hypothetical protein
MSAPVPRQQSPLLPDKICDHVLAKSFRIASSNSRQPTQQARLNVMREVFSSRFPSMIAALKQAIAIYGNDPEWTRVRSPLVELTTEQAELRAAELKAIGFAMPGIATEAAS